MLYFPPFSLALGKCGRGHFGPEAVPGIIFRPMSFSLPPANTYKHMLNLNLPASKCTVAGPVQPAGGAPHQDQRGRGVPKQGPCECCSPLAMPWQGRGPPMMLLLLQGNTAQEVCQGGKARKEATQEKASSLSCSLIPGGLRWGGRSSPACTLHQKQMGVEVSAEGGWYKSVIWDWKIGHKSANTEATTLHAYCLPSSGLPCLGKWFFPAGVLK